MRHTLYLYTLVPAVDFAVLRVFSGALFVYNAEHRNKQICTELQFGPFQNAVIAPFELFDEYQFRSRHLPGQFGL
jgi:hypothetical protein